MQVTIQGLGDTWNWAGAAESWANFADLCPAPKVIELMRGFHNTLGENDVMAYLVMMAPRLYHLWRVLKPTGSLYLHCDPTASHYLKLILDGIFGAKNFKNEIVWQRANVKGDVRRKFGANHDISSSTRNLVISMKSIWNASVLMTMMAEDYIALLLLTVLTCAQT